jgi:hypothetical protein
VRCLHVTRPVSRLPGHSLVNTTAILTIGQSSILYEVVRSECLEEFEHPVQVYLFVGSRSNFEEGFSNIEVYSGELLQHRYKVLELRILWVIVPRDAREGIRGLEEVTRGGVVDDDHVFNGPTESRHVLHEEFVMHMSAVLPVKNMVDYCVVGIQLGEKGLSIPRETCCKHHDLEQRSHRLEELVTEGPLASEDLLEVRAAWIVRNIDREHDFSVWHVLKLRVYKRLVQIDHEHLLALLGLRLHSRQEELLWRP